MSGIRETKKRRTRKAIQEAAITLFSQKGFEATSMEELARAAGVGKGTIYGYFRTKHEIFLAFCEEEIDHAFAALEQRSDPDAPMLEQLLTLFLSQFDFVTANREFGRLMLREILFPAPETVARSQELTARYQRGVGEILSRGIGRGELKAGIDPLLTLGHLYALYNIVVHACYAGDLTSRREVEVVLRAMLVQALNGLAPVELDEVPDPGVFEAIHRRFSLDGD